MSDSDSDCGDLIRLNSGPLEYEIAPSEIEFKLKVKNENRKWIRFIYTLKKGSPLPYTPSIAGVNLSISTILKPLVNDKAGAEAGGWWKFEEQVPLPSVPLPLPDNVFTEEDTGPPSSVLNLDMTVEIHETSSNNLNITFDEESEVSRETAAYSRSPVTPQTNPTQRSCASGSTPSSLVTPHTYQNWLGDLKKGFRSLVIDKCSYRTRQAVDSNEAIKDNRASKDVMNEIVNTVMEYLEKVFGISTPRLKDMREIVVEMGHQYPAMFHNCEPDVEFDGYEAATSKLDLNDLAQKMINRFRDRKRRAVKQGVAQIDEEGHEVPKKGKRKQHYGVDQLKFMGKKASPDAIEAINQTSTQADAIEREKVYEKNRPEMQYQFRNSSNNISKICKGFFEDPIHLAKHFSYVTGAGDLTEQVEKNFRKQIGNLEMFLSDADKSLEFKDKISAIETSCEVEYNGSQVFKQVQLLRLAGDFLDTNGSSLIRLASDGPTETSGPFIMAVEVDKCFIFELWVEKTRILGYMKMTEAIAALLHLVFVFDLKYPEDSETVGDILQRLVGKYGDDTGSRTKSKISAKSKFNNYMRKIGSLLVQHV